MNQIMYTLPATWLDALVSRDYSGLDKQSETNILHWLENNNQELDSCISVDNELIGKDKESPAVLMKCYIRPGIMVYCECLEYTFKVGD